MSICSIPSLRRLADDEDPQSLSNRLRSRRFRQFEALLADLPRPLHILDVGGTNSFWRNRGWAGRDDIEITTLNMVPESRRYRNIVPVQGDARDLSQFTEGSFAVVFSNSVIEHLFTFENQCRMASEVQRVGRAFWVQTPNYWFPVEPHFHVPGWQWMPVDLRVALIRRFACGWRGPTSDPARAKSLVQEVRLLTKNELKKMFPGANLRSERFCGLIKSWIVTGGFRR